MRIALFVFILSCSVAQAGTFTHAPTNLHFPDRLAKWKKVKVTQFPQKHLGVEIDYSGPGDAIASFYIYTGGVGSIPTGAQNAAVKREFVKTQDEMASAMQSRFRNVQKFMESTPDVTNKGRKATLLAAAYQFHDPTPGGHRRLSWVLLTGFKHHFLKLRYTHLYDKDTDTGQEALRDLVMSFLAANEDNAASFWMR